MITITKVVLLQETLVNEIDKLGGRITYEQTQRDWVDGTYRSMYWEVEAYFPSDEFHEIESEIEDLIDGTAWQWDACWDLDAGDEQGVLFERHLSD